MTLKLNDKYLGSFVNADELAAISPEVQAAHDLLMSRTGAGNDFLGWLDLPVNYDKDEAARIVAAAEKIQKSCDIFVVIGIIIGATMLINYLFSDNDK